MNVAQQLGQPLGSGAKVFEIPGVFDDCMKVVEYLSENFTVALMNSKNAWRILGQESYSYEIAQIFDYDVANLSDTAAGDLIRGFGWNNQLLVQYGGSSTHLNDAMGFNKVTVDVSAGGYDTVSLQDSGGNDTFTGDAGWAEMINDTANYWFRIQGMHKDSPTGPGDSVAISSTKGGTDHDHHVLATIDYLFSKSGPWV